MPIIGLQLPFVIQMASRHVQEQFETNLEELEALRTAGSSNGSHPADEQL
jgi:hypothetical protein